MRDVAAALERLGLRWYLTGSEALARYGAPRQSMDTDVMVEAAADHLEALGHALRMDYYFAEPLHLGNRLMASLVRRDGSGKVDLIVREADPWGRVAMERRVRWQHPTWGSVWVSSLEDLLLAKLEWSEGTSELQLRDCAMLLRMNGGSIDRRYLERWAQELGVAHLLADLTGRAPNEA